jgi:hypothetical protein
MYQNDFVCTYQNLEDLDEADILYKLQLLQAFDLNTWDDTIVNNSINDLYKKLKSNNNFDELLKLCPFYIENGDNEMNFMYLFSYNTFYLLHSWLCYFLKEEEVSEEKQKALIQKLKNG